MLDETFNHAAAGLYRAAWGEEPWNIALQRVTEGFSGIGAQFVCVDNGTGALTFSQADSHNG